MSTTAKLLLSIFDGTRQLISNEVEILVTLRDGHQTQVHRDYHHGPRIEFDVPFFNNLGDDYAVIAWAKKYQQAGFHPVQVKANMEQAIDLMLLPKKGKFNFAQAEWTKLSQTRPQFAKLLSHGAANATEAKKRYQQLRDEQPAALACFLNIATALAEIHLPEGSPLDYMKELIWDGKSIKQDRFFGFADKKLIDQVKLATAHGDFAPEPGPGLLHPGATSSYKQVQFGEADVQLTFHEGDTLDIDGVNCVKVEPDIDYFKDPLAHAILEVLSDPFTGPTDPKVVYILRWIAGRHAGVPEFDPPYTIE